MTESHLVSVATFIHLKKENLERILLNVHLSFAESLRLSQPSISTVYNGYSIMRFNVVPTKGSGTLMTMLYKENTKMWDTCI